MKHPSLLLISLALPVLSLTGCSASFAPESLDSATPAVVQGPPISGSVYGGHAPLVGAKVYVLSPNTSANAGLSTSLMNSTSSTTGGSPVTKDASGGVTNGMYYVTADANGIFNLTGDYTCTVNQPVYIAAVGGAPSYAGAGPNSFPLATQETRNNSSTGVYLTYTTSATELFYVGESVTISGYTGGSVGFNQSGTVLSSVYHFNGTTGTLSTTSFSIFVPYNATLTSATGNYSPSAAPSGAIVTGTPASNPAAVNMAALGLCPPSGTFAGTISFIYMNEISTVALAYATAAFGSDAFHIGVATGGPLDLTGPNGGTGYVTGSMVQAFNNANLLYDITGSNISTTYAGEGHIARLTTPAGNGTVPQALINTLGNILAACVDSANTTSTTSPACNILFSNATLTGATSGTNPTDIAAAAFNIAHHPAGTGNASFMSNIFNLPTGNVPFAPDLSTAPNDFSVGIQFSVPRSSGSSTNLLAAPIVMSFDAGTANGTEYNNSNPVYSLWIGDFNGQPYKLFANGTPDYTTNTALAGSGTTRDRSVTVDSQNNVWIFNENTNSLQKFSNSGSLLVTINPPSSANSDYFSGSSVALDGSGNIYADYTGTIAKYNASGAPYDCNGVLNGPCNVNGSGNWSANNGSIQNGTSLAYTYIVTLDPTGNVYTTNTTGFTNYTTYVLNPTNAATLTTTTGCSAWTDANAIIFPAVDGASSLWCTNSQNNQLYSYSYASRTVSGPYTGGGLNDPDTVAVDGAGNIWIANDGFTSAGNESVSEFNASGTAISPANGFGPLSGQYGHNSSQVAVDRAGNVWAAYTGYGPAGTTAKLVEYIGLATPTVSPTAFATFNGYLGQRPR